MKLSTALPLAATLACVLLTPSIAFAQSSDWPIYGGESANDHYSPLTQINRDNVEQLHVAWSYDTHETGGLQTSPLIVGRILYGVTPSQKVFALDASTGKLLWTFDSGVKGTQPVRGLTLWCSDDGKEQRLLAGLMNYLYAIDPATGKLISSFGENGRIDLRKDLRGDYHEQSIAMTAPGVLYKDLIITGGRMPETHPAPPGDIRAFDVHTGKLRWSFHTIPHPGEAGYETWPADAWQRSGAANNWTGMTVDAKRGIVYAPTGSAVDDFYGGDRKGDDLYANTLLALDANTGKRIWHFQDVHHDLWDRDFPSPPTLVTVMHNGQRVDAVAQTTKQAFVYLFNRTTGEPLFPIEEHAYPPSTVPGESAAATQPLPLVPEPFGRQRITEETLTNRTPEAHAYALEKFRQVRSDGQFIPFSLDKLTIIFPGFDGGAEWGGSAVDPKSGVLYVNENEMAWLGGLVETREGGSVGEKTFQQTCSVCHGPTGLGAPPAFPALTGVTHRLSAAEIATTVHQGKGRMPGFPGIDSIAMQSLLEYLKTLDTPPAKDAAVPEAAHKGKQEPEAKHEMDVTEGLYHNTSSTSRYQFTGYRKFLDQDGYPAISPPWGTLNAIDLNTGKYLWKIPFGEYPELVAKGMHNTGSENYGGPIVTAGGVVFIGATIFDKKLHAYDSRTGKLLWETVLPYAGLATPATYEVDGKQYVVIATGGGRDPKAPSGGEYIAFALP
ncbi:MAG TPA: PQQ-binding-like beta-propeller repeat protein [Acidobacteriaceae bacterium]|nr:PQQ-binding-like beta-propeller repeat protein [Acidobacteriaceae bacterium]